MVKGASRWVTQQVEGLVSTVRGRGVYQVPSVPCPPTGYLFVIPRSSEKVSLILRCAKQNRWMG